MHSTECVALAATLGFDCGEASASAAAILGATGVDTTAVAAKRKLKIGAPPAASDVRSDVQRLEESTPGVAAAIRMLLKRPDVGTLGSASPKFSWRAVQRVKAERSEKPGTNTSTLDLVRRPPPLRLALTVARARVRARALPISLGHANARARDRCSASVLSRVAAPRRARSFCPRGPCWQLHDLLYETDLWNTNKKDDDKYREVTAAKLAQWAGAAGAAAALGAASDGKSPRTASPQKGQLRHEEEAAGLYLRFVRELEGTKQHHLVMLATLLGVQRLKSGGQQRKADTSQRPPELAGTLNGVGRKSLAPVTALFLALPCEMALYLDEREGQGRQALGKAEMAGDPGFLVTGPPLRAGLAIRLGVVVSASSGGGGGSGGPPRMMPTLPAASAFQNIFAPAAASGEAAVTAAIAAAARNAAMMAATAKGLAPQLPPGTSAMELVGFRVGMQVRIFGLTKAPQYNGQLARVDGWLKDEQRVQVHLPGFGNKQVALKPSNLAPVAAAAAAPPSHAAPPQPQPATASSAIASSEAAMSSAAMSAAALKAVLRERGISSEGALEKSDLVELVRKSGGLPTSSPKAKAPAAPATSPPPPSAPPSAPSSRCKKEAADDEVAEVTGRAPKMCGTPGCVLPDFHGGLCSSTSVASKRESPARSPGLMKY